MEEVVTSEWGNSGSKELWETSVNQWMRDCSCLRTTPQNETPVVGPLPPDLNRTVNTTIDGNGPFDFRVLHFAMGWLRAARALLRRQVSRTASWL